VRKTREADVPSVGSRTTNDPSSPGGRRVAAFGEKNDSDEPELVSTPTWETLEAFARARVQDFVHSFLLRFYATTYCAILFDGVDVRYLGATSCT
jgi:hypothetical protein